MIEEQKYLLPQPETIIPTPKEQFFCYSFTNTSNICNACRVLSLAKKDFTASLYFSDERKYYLFIAFEGKEKSSPFSVLSEFGELENAEKIQLSLLERGQCICKDNAIDILSKI